MKKIASVLTVLTIPFISQVASAGMTGTYKSDAACKLTVEVLSGDAGYADAKYNVRSDGTGACEWTGVGVGKRFTIEAGVVSQSSTSFAQMNWLYGPEGDKVEITFFDTDGTVRHKEVFEREKQSVANN